MRLGSKALSDSKKKLQNAFVSGLGLEGEVNFADLEYGKHELWDSIAHMQLVADIEREFGIMMDTDDVVAMSSYLVAEGIVVKYGVTL
jgi:acyl carrier protein